MEITKTAPRISIAAAEVIADNFANLNNGCEYILNSWPDLYRRTIFDMKKKFDPAEFKLMIDVFNSTALTHNLAGQQLLTNCADGIDLDGLDQKWNIEKNVFLEKIQSLTIFEEACLEIWANGFWYGSAGKRPLDIEAYIV